MRNKWIGSAGKENRRDVIAKIMDKAERSSKQWSCSVSNFLPISTWKEAEKHFKNRADISCIPFGGYENAERCRLLLGSREMTDNVSSCLDWQCEYLAALQVDIPGALYLQSEINHRHYLGSILGTGIVRDVVGDVLVHDKGAQIIVNADMSSYLQSELTHIGRVPVKVKEIQFSDLQVPNYEEMKTTIRFSSSRRLDAVVSSCFGLSRSKAAFSIKKGDIKLNWEQTSSGSQSVESGDVISFKGLGRAKLVHMHTNQKGRNVLELLLFR